MTKIEFFKFQVLNINHFVLLKHIKTALRN